MYLFSHFHPTAKIKLATINNQIEKIEVATKIVVQFGKIYRKSILLNEKLPRSNAQKNNMKMKNQANIKPRVQNARNLIIGTIFFIIKFIK